MATREDVIARWPALAKVESADSWNAVLADVAAEVPESVWGDRTEVARVHLVAHRIAVSNPEVRDTGAVQSESVGPVSRTYAVSAQPVSHGLSGTPYGQEFLRIRRQIGLGGMAV